MTKYKSENVFGSIKNAFHGLALIVSSQRNFIIEMILGITALIFALLLHFSVTDICILIIVNAFVLICELINSIIEFTLDAVYKNNYSSLVKMTKDISAAMVLITLCFAIIVDMLLFGKYIYSIYASALTSA